MGLLNRASRFIRDVRHLPETLPHRYIVDRAGESETIFLAGAGRSGTTWIAETLTRQLSCRYMFEPFHNEKVGPWIGRPRFLYLREGDNDPQILAAAKQIIDGQIRTEWSDMFNRRIFSRCRLIKEIRTNLMLGWLRRNFPRMRMVFVIRHPGAVINSRMQLKWDIHLDEFRKQPQLMGDFLVPFEHLFHDLNEPFEQQMLRWCIEHYIPLRQLAGTSVPVMYYEDFCHEPRAAFTKLFESMGIAADLDEVVKNSTVPSRLARPDSAINKGGNLTQSWRKHFTDEQLASIHRLLSAFQLDQLYTDAGAPNHAGLDALLAG